MFIWYSGFVEKWK